MIVDVKVLLVIKTRRYRDSLVALLATMPGLEIRLGSEAHYPGFDSSSLLGPDLLLYECDPNNRAQLAALDAAHMIWPKMKIILFVDAPKTGPLNHLYGIDLVLPVETTVGDLFQSISRLLGRKISTKHTAQPDPLVIPCIN